MSPFWLLQTTCIYIRYHKIAKTSQVFVLLSNLYLLMLFIAHHTQGKVHIHKKKYWIFKIPTTLYGGLFSKKVRYIIFKNTSLKKLHRFCIQAVTVYNFYGWQSIIIIYTLFVIYHLRKISIPPKTL